MLIDSGADINIEKVTTSLSFLLLLSLFWCLFIFIFICL
jgi:hypothetical protein